MKSQLFVVSLREQVYEYLRNEMTTGSLTSGSTINLTKIAEQLGISKTPLRDALIHLEIEGFVTILPRRGVMVNALALNDVKNAYEAIGIIEAAIILDCFDKITSAHISRLEELNERMIKDVQTNDFSRLFKTNLAFHNVFNTLSGNPLFNKFMLPIKHRLYDFQGQSYIHDWELKNCEEHSLFINFLKQENPRSAAMILKDFHWSYSVNEAFIKQFYAMTEQN
ncbi:MAG: GntR family transcriptional regulator [Deltaproteobacteria bacterium]|nr:MAG: GntR family transcriptional regulator [Deltaproteobacteria bacterium]